MPGSQQSIRQPLWQCPCQDNSRGRVNGLRLSQGQRHLRPHGRSQDTRIAVHSVYLKIARIFENACDFACYLLCFLVIYFTIKNHKRLIISTLLCYIYTTKNIHRVPIRRTKYADFQHAIIYCVLKRVRFSGYGYLLNKSIAVFYALNVTMYTHSRLRSMLM